MDKYSVTGMSCAACQSRVEKAVSGVEGVSSCAVSLLTNSMGVEGTANPSDIIRAVEDAGYGAKLMRSGNGAAGGQSSGAADEIADSLKDRETPVLARRLVASVVLLLALMYISMGHMMWGWPLPVENHVLIALVEMLIAILVIRINEKFFTSGFRALIGGAPNMDTLVALGSTAAFVYSLAVMCMMIVKQGRGESIDSLAMNLYFESAAMIPTLITVGKLLEARAKGKTTDALKSLVALAPKTANVIRNGDEVTVPAAEVMVGDIYVVRTGEHIPVDGVITDGSAAVDESMLTGESIPIDKYARDAVSAGTVCTNGYISCRATKVGEDTALSQIIRMVSDAAATKAPLARIADKVSGIFVPAVMVIALITFAGWLIYGADFSYAIARGISVLVISCPCALGLATPVAIMVGSGVGAKNGILYKTSEALEVMGRVDVVVLDKTGTITEGKPVVTDVIPADDVMKDMLVSIAGLLEQRSEHPLSKAVTDYASTYEWEQQNLGITPEEAGMTDFEVLPGKGLRATVADTEGNVSKLYGGNEAYIWEIADIPDGLHDRIRNFSEEGKTPLLFAIDDKLYDTTKVLGCIAVMDTVRADSPEAIETLKRLGVATVMLTGDNERTAATIGSMAGVDKIYAGVRPDGKEQVIRRLQDMTYGDKKKHLKVAMVGDGINDAPALTAAEVGVAIGNGTDVAIDSADVVLMKSTLTDLAAAVRLSRSTIRNIHENLFWAFIYNLVCIPLAAGLYGIAMKPMYGAAAMALSSFCVCMNALRLNGVKIYKGKRDKAKKNYEEILALVTGEEEEISKLEVSYADETAEGLSSNKDDNNVKSIEDSETEVKDMKTLEIKGMMCGHCEATVKKALEAVDGVVSAEVSHENGTAIVTTDKDVADDVLIKAVTDRDYEVTDIH